MLKITTPHRQVFYIDTHEDDKSVRPQLLKGRYEPHVQILINEYCKNINSILDLGANYGQHTILMSMLNPNAKITAVEASIENIEILRRNLEYNNINNVEIINSLLSNKDDESYFYFESTNSACSFSCETTYGDDKHLNAKRKIQTNKLSTILDINYDFIKMDIEGSEYNVIKSSPDIFRSANTLLIELNKFTLSNFYNISINDLIDEIYRLNFTKAFVCGVSGDKYHIWDINESDLKNIMKKTIMMEVLFVK